VDRGDVKRDSIPKCLKAMVEAGLTIVHPVTANILKVYRELEIARRHYI